MGSCCDHLFMSRLGRTLLIVVVALLTPSIVSAQNFTVVSVPDPYTAIYTDGSGRTITVRGEPQNTSCFAFDATGVADVFARSSIAACDRAIEIRFETSDSCSIAWSIQILTISTAPRLVIVSQRMSLGLGHLQQLKFIHLLARRPMLIRHRGCLRRVQLVHFSRMMRATTRRTKLQHLV